ncbi:MAG: protein-tyrosine phosphatase family protein [Cocleimonas sp.]
MNQQSNSVIRNNVMQLMDIKGEAERRLPDPKRDRFNMSDSSETSVHEDLNGNRIVINRDNIAIATQYPFDYQLETQFQMMVDNRTPALVILASNYDIQKNKLPDYFSSPQTFGQIKTGSIPIRRVELGNRIEAYVYKMDVSGYQEAIDIPLIHVHNWPDHQTVSPETTTKLVALIESTIAEKREFYEKQNDSAINDPEKMLPVIHCRAGVGRTGQTIAAMAMKRNPELSLASITKDLRVSRNNSMIQTPIQMETLVRLEVST